MDSRSEAALQSADANYWTPSFGASPDLAPLTLRPFGARGVGEILIIDMDKQALLREKLAELFPEAKLTNCIVPGPFPFAPRNFHRFLRALVASRRASNETGNNEYDVQLYDRLMREMIKYAHETENAKLETELIKITR